MSAQSALDRLKIDRERALATVADCDRQEAAILARLDSFPALAPFDDQAVPGNHYRGQCCRCSTPTFVLPDKFSEWGQKIAQGDDPICASCRVRSHVARLVNEGKLNRGPCCPFPWEELTADAAFDPGPCWTTKGVLARVKDGLGDELSGLVREHLATEPPGAGRLVRTIADASASFKVDSYSTRNVGGKFFLVTATRNPGATTAEGALPITFLGLLDGESFGVLASC